MSTMQMKHNPTKYLTPLTPAQMKDVQDLIIYTEANRKPLRKPRIRRRDPNSTPRPVNCFLVYRKEKQAQIAELCVGANHRVISKIVARWWKNIDPETKALYVDVAKQVKKEHAVKFPGYKYAPKRKQSSTNQENVISSSTQPISPATFYFQRQEEKRMAEYLAAVPTSQTKAQTTSSFTCEATKQFYDMIYDSQSFPMYQDNGLDPTQPLVDDSMAQYMNTQYWQADYTDLTAFNKVMVPPQIILDSILPDSTSVPQSTDWSANKNPPATMIDHHQQDAIHPLDLMELPSLTDFSSLGYDLDNVFWPLDTPSFNTPNNNTNMLDMICTPDLLAENGSPLSISSPYAYPSSFSSRTSQFVHPLAAVKAVDSPSSV